MIICKKCDVELDEDMLICPLCGTPVSDEAAVQIQDTLRQQSGYSRSRMSRPQKRFTWEIISIILISGITASFTIDFLINKTITWSEYPIAISLTIFSYISLLVLWHRHIILQMIAGFLFSSLFLIALDALTDFVGWSVHIAIPILFLASLIVCILIIIIRASKNKGINLIAYAFLAAALICISIDSILSFSKQGTLQTGWSIIVTGSIIPVVLVLLFVNFRLKKGQSLEKTFHI